MRNLKISDRVRGFFEFIADLVWIAICIAGGCYLIYVIIVKPFTQKKEQIISTSILTVRNNVLSLYGTEMCRFIPVVGGEMRIENVMSVVPHGDTYNFDTLYQTDDYLIGSFMISDIPVTEKLYSFVMKTGDTINFFDYSRILDIYALHTRKEWDVFIQKLQELTGRKFRLPTYQEWEYAASGGIKSRNFIYSGSNNINDVAYYNGNVDSSYNPRWGKMRRCNELGIYDMSGSVWELTSSTRYDLFPRLRQLSKFIHNDFNYYIVRGGCSGSPAEECAIKYPGRFYLEDSLTGARLVLVY